MSGSDDDDSRKGDSKNEKENNDQENGGEEKPPTPVGFWDPRLKHVRKEVMGKWVLTTVVLMAFVLACLSIYWGAFFNIEKNLSSLVIYVVDFDGIAPFNTGDAPVVGPTITGMIQQELAKSSHLGFGSLPPSDFGNDPLNVRRAIYNFEAWAAIIINPNATSMLYSAIRNGNTSYDPMGACQLIYMSARDDTNWYDFLYPMLSQFMTQATTMVAQQWTPIALREAATAGGLANLQAAPQAVNPAVAFSQFDLRPFYPYTTIPSVSIALIYLIIVAFFSFTFYLPVHMKYLKPEGHPPLKFYQLIIWRWLTTMLAYFFISLAYSLISLAFQINFFGSPVHITHVDTALEKYNNPASYGHGTFPVYWMLNFVGMAAVGLACENVAMVVGQPWTSLWLIFWVITNVSTAFYDIDIEAAFYRWGYAFPLHNIVEASRSILFDLHSRLGLNFGVLFAWVGVNSVLFPVCCYIMRLKTKKGFHEYWA